MIFRYFNYLCWLEISLIENLQYYIYTLEDFEQVDRKHSAIQKYVRRYWSWLIFASSVFISYLFRYYVPSSCNNDPPCGRGVPTVSPACHMRQPTLQGMAFSTNLTGQTTIKGDRSRWQRVFRVGLSRLRF